MVFEYVIRFYKMTLIFHGDSSSLSTISNTNINIDIPTILSLSLSKGERLNVIIQDSRFKKTLFIPREIVVQQ